MITEKINKNDFVAKADVIINAAQKMVWHALTTPGLIKKYMFGTTVVSDWEEGSKITWKGIMDYKIYEDYGVITKFEPPMKLQYTHFSPLSLKEDAPENYHTVTFELKAKGNKTIVFLTQDNNGSEKERDHSQKNWQMMLDSLKKVVEESSN